MHGGELREVGSVKWTTKQGKASLMKRSGWHPWFAWKPVTLPEINTDALYLPQRRAWLCKVDRRLSMRLGDYVWEYRDPQ